MRASVSSPVRFRAAGVGVLALAVAASVSGCSATAGPRTTEDREIGDVTRVVLRTGGDLVIVVGDTPSLSITAGENTLDRLTSESRDGVLTLDSDAALNLGTGDIDYALTVTSLEGVFVEGSGDVDADLAGVQGPTGGVTFSIEGSGDIDAYGVDVESATLTIDGSGDLTVEGTANDVGASIGGSGEIDAEGLVGVDAVASIDGSGSIEVHATGTLDARISGSGSISYSGRPEVTQRIDGSGSVSGD